jgi:predicted kinase
MPASGKTTLARRVAAELRMPLLEKDVLKEELFDTLGTGDVEWSQRLGTATYELLVLGARALLAAGRPVILEANFFRGSEPRFRDLPVHRLVQVHCHAPLDVLLDRYRERVTTRHPGHLDALRVDEVRARFESNLNGALSLDGELVPVDTASLPVEDTVALVVALMT